MAEDKLKNKEILLIGGSAGSLDVVLRILEGLPKTLNLSIVIVLHRKSTSDSSLTRLLDIRSTVSVKEAEEKEEIVRGMIYLAPADYHLLIERDHTFSLDSSEKVQFSRPSIDVTFQSAAEVYKSSTAALLLSGANSDGSEGIKSIADEGGLTIVQNPVTAEVPFMPKAAIMATVVDYVTATTDLSDLINKLSAAQLIE